MKSLFVFILAFTLGLSSQSRENSYFLPALPGMEDSFEEAGHLDSMSAWEEKITNDFYTISDSWKESVDKILLEYSIAIQNSDVVHDKEIYQIEFLNYFQSLKESIYANWKEEIFEKIVNESTIFYSSILGKEEIESEIYEKHPDYYVLMDSLATQKEEFLTNIDETSLIYEKNLLEIERLENDVRNSIRTTAEEIRKDLVSNNLYYILDDKGNRIKVAGEDSLNSSGTKLESILNKIDEQLLENRSISEISKELEIFLKSESIQARSTSDSWSAKINSSYSNANSSLIGSIPFISHPEMYDSNSWTNLIKQYFSGSSAELRSKIESDFLADPNITLNSIQYVDMVAYTPNPYRQWNSNPLHPNSNIGGSYSTVGDSFKYYLNHTIICWGYCIPYDIQVREDTIFYELQFSAIDENAKKNSEIWNSFSQQMDSKSNLWKISLIPTIQTWEAKKEEYLVLNEKWIKKSSLLKSNIELEFNEKVQKVNSKPNDFNFTSELSKSSTIFEEIIEAKKSASSFQMEDLSSLSYNFMNSLEGIRNLGLYTKLNDDLISSRKDIMENLKNFYSSEKILTEDTNKIILEKFMGSGICAGENFKNNSGECNGYIEEYGTKKYKSVTLDENLNLIFEKSISSGKVEITGWDKTNINNYKVEDQIESFKVLGISNFKISEVASVDLFSDSTLSSFYSTYSNHYKKVSDFNYSSFNTVVSRYNEELSSLSDKNKKLAQSFIQESISQSSLILDFATSILSGGTVKSWINSTILTKTATAIGEQLGIDPQLLISYFNYKQNKKRLQNQENNLTGGFIPKGLAVPLAQWITNSLAEQYKFLTSYYGGIAGVFVSSKTKQNWKKDQRLKEKNLRLKDYKEAVAAMDYKSQYKADIKSTLYTEISKHIFQNTSIDPGHVSKLMQYLDNKKAEEKQKEAETNQKLITGLQVITAILFPPSAGLTLATLSVQIGSALAQAAIASSSGDNRSTFSTFATAMAGSVLGSLPISPSSGLNISNYIANTSKLGLGLSLSYTPQESISSLGAAIDQTLNGSSPSGWGGGIYLGAKGIHAGIGSENGAITLNLGGGAGSTGFYEVSSNSDNGNIGLTLGLGSKFGTSMGAVINSVLPSTLFASYNPDSGNPMGLGTSISVSETGNLNLGIELGKNEALSSSFSTSGGWSSLQANANYQAELNSMYAEELGNTNILGDTNSSNANSTSPLLLLYGLMGLLGLYRRKEDILGTDNKEAHEYFVLPTNLNPTPNSNPENLPFDQKVNLVTDSIIGKESVSKIINEISTSPEEKTALLQILASNLIDRNYTNQREKENLIKLLNGFINNTFYGEISSKLKDHVAFLQKSSDPLPLSTVIEPNPKMNQNANLSHDEPGRKMQSSLLGSLMCNETVLAGILQSLGTTKNDIITKLLSLNHCNQISLLLKSKNTSIDLLIKGESGEMMFNPVLETVPMADLLEAFRLEMKKSYFLDKYEKNRKLLESNSNTKPEKVQLYAGNKVETFLVGDKTYHINDQVDITQFSKEEILKYIGIFDEPGSYGKRAKKWDRENSDTLNKLAKEFGVSFSTPQSEIAKVNLNPITDILKNGGKILSLGDFAFPSSKGEVRNNSHYVEIIDVSEKGVILNNPYGAYDPNSKQWKVNNSSDKVFGQNNFYSWADVEKMNLKITSVYKKSV